LSYARSFLTPVFRDMSVRVTFSSNHRHVYSSCFHTWCMDIVLSTVHNCGCGMTFENDTMTHTHTRTIWFVDDIDMVRCLCAKRVATTGLSMSFWFRTSVLQCVSCSTLAVDKTPKDDDVPPTMRHGTGRCATFGRPHMCVCVVPKPCGVYGDTQVQMDIPLCSFSIVL
jgi:hypothetical protein